MEHLSTWFCVRAVGAVVLTALAATLAFVWSVFHV